MRNRAMGGLFALCRLAVGAAFAVVILAVLVQVLGRSIFASSPVWTEELTRFALLYLTAFGAGLSLRTGDLVNVDIISEALPGRWPLRMRFLAAVATALLCAALIWPAWRFTSIGALQTSPALGWRMDFIHGSMLVFLVVLFLTAAARVVAMFLGRSDGRPHFDPENPQ